MYVWYATVRFTCRFTFVVFVLNVMVERRVSCSSTVGFEQPRRVRDRDRDREGARSEDSWRCSGKAPKSSILGRCCLPLGWLLIQNPGAFQSGCPPRNARLPHKPVWAQEGWWNWACLPFCSAISSQARLSPRCCLTRLLKHQSSWPGLDLTCKGFSGTCQVGSTIWSFEIEWKLWVGDIYWWLPCATPLFSWSQVLDSAEEMGLFPYGLRALGRHVA